MDRRRVVGLTFLLLLALALIAARPTAPSLVWAQQLIADWVYSGTTNGDEVGHAVHTAGDVNGDGYDDLAVGAPGMSSDQYYKEGRVCLFYGGAGGLDDLPDWQAGGGQRAARFGHSLAAAGYLNDDPHADKRYADLVVGAPDYNNGVSKAGAAMVFYGSATGLPLSPSWSYVSPQREANLGNAVAGGGDLDGNGYDDLIVAARWYSDTLSKEGVVLVFYSSPAGLPASPHLVLAGGQAGATLGNGVAGGGDVNGDGYADLLAGAPLYDYGQTDVGAVFLYLGGPLGLNPTPSWTAYGEAGGAWFGAAVTLAGDTNNDGYDDFVVGAPGDAYRVLSGRLYVYYGSPTGPGPLPGAVMTVSQILSGLGTSLARIGDVNNDGYDDLLAGAYRLEDDHRAEGAALLYFGSAAGLLRTPGWVGWGEKADAAYGYAVGAAGRANSTEFRSIAVGAPVYKLDDKIPLGRAFVYYGPLEPRPHSYIYLPSVRHQVAP
jgi:hypothetical protein